MAVPRGWGMSTPLCSAARERLPEWSNDGEVVTPKDSYFMDPVAFYRLVPPYDSAALAGLPADRKGIDVPFMTQDGALVPPGTQRIWPYLCR